ncbi:MAG TPA: hypothetical protein VKT80_09935 [Chloroflexota bacterium]|nr:hypothetical protein [Chloroflexota bacterium]
MALPAPKRPVVFSGENSMIRLFQSGGDEIVAAASYWRCTYSEFGEGNALVIWADPVVTGLGELAPHAVYADNLAMGRLVTTQFNQYLRGYQNRGFGEMLPKPARFFQQGDGRRQHRVTCLTGNVTIELLWKDVLDASLCVFDNTSGDRKFEVTSVICPCAHASISVDGKFVAAEVRHQPGTTDSSAFLALSETWVGR